MSVARTESSSTVKQPFVNAAGVAWALSGFAAGSLLVGIAAVEFLGPFSKSPRLERDPQVVPSERTEPAVQRPVVLPSMSAQSRDTENKLLFSAPSATTQDAPARPTLGTAALPTDTTPR